MNLFRIASAWAALVIVAMQAHAGLINGDFETGDLTGWTTFTTSNGTIGNPNVVLFDTNNNGNNSLAAHFLVGEVSHISVNAGGGIFQNVVTGSGLLSINADIAARQIYTTYNDAGGLFELLFDGVVVDSYDFGHIDAGTTEHSTLASMNNVVAGTHEIAIRMTRPYLTGVGLTPEQYIDNVVLSGTAVSTVPEPTSMALWGLGTLGLGALVRRRRKQQREQVA